MILNESLIRRLKQILLACGLLLGVAGLPLFFAFICTGTLITLMGERGSAQIGLSLFIAALITFGAGWSLVLHSSRALNNKESKVMHLWPAWKLMAFFGVVIVVGGITSFDWFSALFFPPTLALAALLPPLAAVSWFANEQNPSLTWRRGTLAFISGGTVSVIITVALEFLLISIILALVVNLGRQALFQIQLLLNILTGSNFSAIINHSNYTYLLIQLVIIAPIIEELIKPLAILPLASRLPRQGAFLIGAMAGVGFATLENMLYAGFGFSFWAGILVVRAIGGAIHPLGAGLMTLAWRDFFQGEAKAKHTLFLRFGQAIGIHALWNGGSLLVVTLSGAALSGGIPSHINILGVSAGVTTLVVLITLGLVALWLGRSTVQQLAPTHLSDEPLDETPEETPEQASDTISPQISNEASAPPNLVLSEQNTAIWALACLIIIIPIGIGSLQILLR